MAENKKDLEEIQADGMVSKFLKKHFSTVDNSEITQDELSFLRDFEDNANKRYYEAGRQSNMKSFWQWQAAPEDTEIYKALKQMRATSRNLERNNSLFKKYLEMVETNISGHQGFATEVVGEDSNGKLDTAGNKAVKKSWEAWCESEWCDITGKLSFKDITRVSGRTTARDGEIIVRLIKQKATRKNPWGLSLQLLDAERLDIDYTAKLNNGNIIRMGVEMDLYGRAIAYHLRAPTVNTTSAMQGSFVSEPRERVIADDIIHLYDITNPEQTRGVPWGHAVMTLIGDLEDFLRACLIAAKVGASSSIYLERDTLNSSLTTGQIADLADAHNNFSMELNPGKIRMLPPGVKLQSFMAQYPSQNFDSYVSAMIKLIASGLNISYFVLANSLEKVNFSSGRMGKLDDQEFWMKKQELIKNRLIKPVFTTWLDISLLNGAIKFPNGTVMSATKFDKFKNIHISGRRWPWVDPLKDGQANLLAVKNGFMSKTEVLANLGKSYEKVLQDKRAEMELEKIYGVTFDLTDTKGAADMVPPDENNAEDTEIEAEQENPEDV